MSHPPLDRADAATLVATWEAGVHAVTVLARALTADERVAPTECPGWSVGDVVRHLAAVESFLAGHPVPTHQPDWASLPHVQTDFGRITEVGVDARRGRSLGQVCDELDSLADERLGQLMALDPLALDTRVRGVFGRLVPLEVMLQMRIVDLWVHEQDVRRATGRHGNLGSPGAQLTASRFAAALPKVLAKHLGARPGDVLAVHVDGAVAFRRAAQVGPDGRGHALPAVDVDLPAVRLKTDWETYARLCSGRLDATARSTRERVIVLGSAPWADRVLAALAVTF